MVPAMTAVSKPKSRPPRAATMALRIRVELRDMAMGGDCIEVRGKRKDFRENGSEFAGCSVLIEVGPTPVLSQKCSFYRDLKSFVLIYFRKCSF